MYEQFLMRSLAACFVAKPKQRMLVMPVNSAMRWSGTALSRRASNLLAADFGFCEHNKTATCNHALSGDALHNLNMQCHHSSEYAVAC
jgi:hypothetical protein